MYLIEFNYYLFNCMLQVSRRVNNAVLNRRLLLGRDLFLSHLNVNPFTRGDILAVSYRLAGQGYSFSGICVSVRRASLKRSNSSFSLRNIFGRVAVEFKACVYAGTRFTLKSLNFAKKKFIYKASKLYYLRSKLNRESYVKL